MTRTPWWRAGVTSDVFRCNQGTVTSTQNHDYLLGITLSIYRIQNPHPPTRALCSHAWKYEATLATSACVHCPFGHFTLTVGWEKTFCNWIDNIFPSESPVWIWICNEAACFPCCLAEQLHSHGSLVSAEDGLSFPARCELLSC